MAKKLKKKVEEICGLAELGWEDRQSKANQILASPQRKQQLCNELLGLSFRTLEQILFGIASERQKKEEVNIKTLQRGSALQSNNHDSQPRTLKEIVEQACGPRKNGTLPRKESQIGDLA